MNERKGMPGFDCDGNCEDCETLKGPGVIIVGSDGNDGFPDFFAKTFEDKKPLDEGELSEFMAGTHVQGLKKLLEAVLEKDPPKPFEEDSALPAFANEARKNVHRIKAGILVPLNMHAGRFPGSFTCIDLVYDPETESLTKTLVGTMDRIVKDIGNEEIATLIKTIVEMRASEIKIKKDSVLAGFSLLEKKRDLLVKQAGLVDIFYQTWSETFSHEKEFFIKEEGDSYILCVDGEAQKDQPVSSDVGSEAVALQGKIESLNTEITQMEDSFKSSNQQVSILQSLISKKRAVVSGYLEENPIENGSPLVMAIDPEDSSACLIVEVKINEELAELPKGFLKKVALIHVSKQEELPDGLIKALGIEDLIAELQKTMGAV